MKFGFDIDDTLINLREYAFGIYQEKLGKSIEAKHFHRLNRLEIHELFDLTDEEGHQLWHSLLEELYFTDCPPFTGAVERLQKLAGDGHEIYYLTARPAKHSERTKDWMKQQGFPVEDNRFYCGMKDDEKVHIIEELELDFYFDDKPAVVKNLTRDSLTVVLKDQSYNRHLTHSRINHWDELEQLIEQGTKSK